MRTYWIAQGTLFSALWEELNSMLNGKEIQKRGDKCIHMADSLALQ